MPAFPDSLARAYSPQISEKRSQVSIQRLGPDDEPGEIRVLQHFPDSINDTKGVTWSPKDVPGGSLPLYQWTSSGERSISFSAIFTTDVDFTQSQAGTTAVEEGSSDIIDIRSAVLWLRSFVLPSYPSEDMDPGGGSGLTRAPSKLVLTIPNSGIGYAGGSFPARPDPDSIVAVMSECSVEWQAFFPSGVPRIATVSLAFLQVGQFNGGMTFPRADATMIFDAERGLYETFGQKPVPFLGYKLRPTE